MESNGEALKIHMSHSTKQILDHFGTFDVTMRGFVSIKGKGEMMTFWLNGEKNSDASTIIIDQNQHRENGVDDYHLLGEKSLIKAIAIVPPLTTQNSFKKVTINQHNSDSSLKDLTHTSLIGKKSSMFGKKKQVSLSNEKLQPLLSTVK